MYSTDAQQCLAYALNVVNIHLISGTTLLVLKLPVITKIIDTLEVLEPTVLKKLTKIMPLAQLKLNQELNLLF